MGLESGKNLSNKLKERRLTEVILENSKIFTSIIPDAKSHDSEATSHNISEIDYTFFCWSSSAAASRSTQTAYEHSKTAQDTDRPFIDFSESETEKVKQYGQLWKNEELFLATSPTKLTLMKIGPFLAMIDIILDVINAGIFCNLCWVMNIMHLYFLQYK